MDCDFETSLQYVLADEGGYADNPDDPGGATNKGITLATYRQVRHNATIEDLRAITPSEVRDIYMRNYWQSASCDKMPRGVDYVAFDCAVNQGVSTACAMMRVIERHGKLPAETEIAMMCSWRRNRYERIAEMHPKERKFLKGWLDRTARAEERAKKMLAAE